MRRNWGELRIGSVRSWAVSRDCLNCGLLKLRAQRYYCAENHKHTLKQGMFGCLWPKHPGHIVVDYHQLVTCSHQRKRHIVCAVQHKIYGTLLFVFAMLSWHDLPSEDIFVTPQSYKAQVRNKWKHFSVMQMKRPQWLVIVHYKRMFVLCLFYVKWVFLCNTPAPSPQRKIWPSDHQLLPNPLTSFTSHLMLMVDLVHEGPIPPPIFWWVTFSITSKGTSNHDQAPSAKCLKLTHGWEIRCQVPGTILAYPWRER